MQRKNCYIVDSCLRKYSKGWRLKTSSEALRKQVAEDFNALFIPPLSPNPSPPPPGRKGELNNHIRPTLCLGWRSRATANVQTCREQKIR